MSKPLRIKVTGNMDDPRSLSVLNADTGEQIANVVSLDIRASRVPADCQIQLTLWGGIELELDGTATVREEGFSRVVGPSEERNT